MKSIALILAGGSISHRVSSELSHIKCPALMPLHLSTIGGLNVQFFSQLGDRVYLAVDVAYTSEVMLNIGVDSSKYTLIAVEGAGGVVDTLEIALNQIKAEHPDNPQVKVNLVTTIPTEDLDLNEVFVAKISGRLVQQCSWLENQAGAWKAHSKNLKTDKEVVDAFTGTFCAKLDDLISATVPLNDRCDLIGAVSNLFNEPRSEIRVRETDWIDCGHEISYLKARSKFLCSRSFNRLSIDLDKGVIRKRSNKWEKMEDEASYFRSLPNELQIYFPRLTQTLADGDGRTCGYELEYYSYPTLAEYALYWKISEDAWWLAFEQLNHILNHFRTFKTSFTRKDHSEALVGKTRKRLDDYFCHLPAQEMELLYHQELVIDGTRCLAFSSIQERFFACLEELYDDTCFTAVHGDLCFNNILYSPGGGLIKLIDPRGSFGLHKGIYGDYRYDLAKLMHSVTGGYDAIVNGHYHLSQNGSNFELNIQTKESGAFTESAFNWLLKQQGVDQRACRILMASLFLSMLPLHHDCSQRQRAFYLNGLKILNELEL